MAPTCEELLDCAIAAARSAGQHALSNRARRLESTDEFKHDVKLVLDVECQDKAEEVVLKAFPNHSVLGEEKCFTVQSDYTWIIDPIDGTVNYFHGLPFWCTSIAVREKSEIIAGAIYAPELDKLYSAMTGSPSLCNDKEIRVSSTDSLAGSIVLTGMDKNDKTGRRPLERFEKIALNTQKARILGSAALDLCMLAEGKADGYFEAGIYIWDIAAGGLIVEQAGGQTEISNYQDDNTALEFVASNGIIQHELKTLSK